MECRIQIRFQNSHNPRLLLSFQLAIAVPFQALIFVAFLTIFRLTRILLLLPCLYEFTIQSHPVSSLLKFVFYKKAAKMDEIFTADLTLMHNVKSMKISSIFVAFLENMNFNQSAPWCFHWYHLQKCSANILWNRWSTKVRWTLIFDIVP